VEVVLKIIYDLFGEKAWAKVVGLLAGLSLLFYRIVNVAVKNQNADIEQDKNLLNRIEQMNKQINSQWDRLDELQNKVDHWRTKYLELEKKAHSLAQENDNLRQTVEEKTQIIEGLQEKEQEYKDKIDKYEEKLN
jgi:septal ring factor EnvC (AmiA/AmiB activator)